MKKSNRRFAGTVATNVPPRQQRARDVIYEPNPMRVEWDNGKLRLTIGRKVLPDGTVVEGVRIFEKECIDCGVTWYANAVWPTRCWDCKERFDAHAQAHQHGRDIHEHPAYLRVRNQIARIEAICREHDDNELDIPLNESDRDERY